MSAIVENADNLVLNLKVRPSARRNAWRGVLGDALKVDVAATAESGRATEELLTFIARSFAVPRADVELISGPRSRQKRVRITGQWTVPPDLQ